MRTERLCRLIVRHFEEAEVPDTFRVSDAALRMQHRGEPPSKFNDKFTMVDMFSGGGRTSCGTVQAGFHVRYAVDRDKDAMATYKPNNPSARIHVEEIGDFLTRLGPTPVRQKWRCYHLHASPPCKFIAWCHTRAGQHDEANQDTMTVVHVPLPAIRPMTVSLEEPDDRDQDWYRNILTDCPSNGHSIAWRISDARDPPGSHSGRIRFLLDVACP